MLLRYRACVKSVQVGTQITLYNISRETYDNIYLSLNYTRAVSSRGSSRGCYAETVPVEFQL